MGPVGISKNVVVWLLSICPNGTCWYIQIFCYCYCLCYLHTDGIFNCSQSWARFLVCPPPLIFITFVILGSAFAVPSSSRRCLFTIAGNRSFFLGSTFLVLFFCQQLVWITKQVRALLKNSPFLLSAPFSCLLLQWLLWTLFDQTWGPCLCQLISITIIFLFLCCHFFTLFILISLKLPNRIIASRRTFMYDYFVFYTV